MLRSRSPEETVTQPDPLASVVAVGLGVIGAALFAAAVLAVYTSSTPAVELPLVVAIALAFVAVVTVFLFGLAVRRLRSGRFR